MTKKISIFLLTVLLLLPIGLMSQAAETPTFAITNATGYAGNEVTVDIECSGNPGIGSWQLIVNYDKTYLELKSVNTNDSVFKENGITQTSKDINDYPYHMAWAYGQENVKANGKVATLTFNIKSNAAPGNYTINVDEFTAYTIDFQKTAFTLQDGTITVKEKETSSNTSSNATSSTTSSNSSSNSSSSGSTGGTTNNNNNIKNAGGTTTAGTNNTTTASQTGKSVTTGDISGTAITLSAFLFCIAIMAITAFIKKAEDN